MKPISGHPCPKCGSSSRVLRTTIGRRKKDSERNFVVRERICSRKKHRFETEERARDKA